jgi:hypothetical protein
MKTPYLFAACEFTLVALLIGGCAAGPAPRSSLPGTTTASPQLERDTVALVLGMDQVADCTCNERKVIGREVSATETTSVSEHWTVDRCGTILRYTVTYSRSPAGGTFIGVGPSPQVVRQGPDRAAHPLPKVFEDVWYRAGDRGFSLTAYSASGKLVISEQRVALGDGGSAFEIGVSEIKSVCWGKMAWDNVNEWVIVRYGSPEKMAGFKDGSRLGWGTGTPSIMSSLSSLLETRSAQPKR